MSMATAVQRPLPQISNYPSSEIAAATLSPQAVNYVFANGPNTRLWLRGWGCGYRTLQTICSWVVFQKQEAGETARAVPSIAEIQAALVLLGDKEARFEGSRDWIGSTEVFLSLDHFYQVPCRILHARTGDQVANHMDALFKHFEQQGSPVMMGGDSDASSKGILGVCQTSSGESHLLVLDPHWYRNDAKHGPLVGAKAHVQQNGWIAWRSLDSLMESSFYNLCLPLLHSTAKSRS